MDSFENVAHFQEITKSYDLEVIPHLFHYEKDGVTPRDPFDISSFMEAEGAIVSRNSNDAIPSKLFCTIRLQLEWTEVILQPEITIKNKTNGDTSRWRLGQYFIETPVLNMNKPNEFKISGYDNISMYNTQVVHSYEVTKDQDILTALETGLLGNTVDWGDVNPRFRFTPTDLVAPNERVWSLLEGNTYLQITNDLLDTLGYRKLFTSRDGAFISEPLIKLRDKTSIVNIDSGVLPSVVALETNYARDTWNVPNTWIGISGNVNRDTPPVANNGLYTLVNQNIGPTSVDVRGRPQNKIVTVDAVNQLALISVVEFEAEKDVSSIEKLTMQCIPFPVFWHEDTANITIKNFNIFEKKMVARNWKLPLDGSDMTIEFDVLNLLPGNLQS